MNKLLDEMNDRLYYLETLDETEEIKGRKAELTLAIVRVQQLLLKDIKK